MKKKVLKSKDLSRHLGLKEKVRKDVSSPRVGLLPDDGSGVLNKRVMDARGKAQHIVEDAGKEAEKMRKEAEELFAQVGTELEQAREKGYKEGREEGNSSVTKQIVAFEKMKEEFYKSAEENIIELVMMVAEKVIGKIVQGHKETVKSIVGQAIESALGERILVRLNPADYKVITDAEYEFRDQIDKTRRITFKEDDSIAQGGCVVETEVGTIDARLETQLKAIRKALEL